MQCSRQLLLHQAVSTLSKAVTCSALYAYIVLVSQYELRDKASFNSSSG
jgi:ABC-type uncharacterized transport system permease subunit